MNLNILSQAPRLVLIEISKLLTVGDIYTMCSLSLHFAMKFGGVVPSNKKNMFYFTNQSIGLHEVWTDMLLRDYGVSYVANRCPINSRVARQMIAQSMKRYCDFITKKDLQYNYEKAYKMRLLYNRLRSNIESEFGQKQPQFFFGALRNNLLPSCHVFMGCVFFVLKTPKHETKAFVISIVDFLTSSVQSVQNLQDIALTSKSTKHCANHRGFKVYLQTKGTNLTLIMHADKITHFLLNDQSFENVTLEYSFEAAFTFFDNSKVYIGLNKQIFVWNQDDAKNKLSKKLIVGDKSKLHVLGGISLGNFGVVATCVGNILARFALDRLQTVCIIEDEIISRLFPLDSLRIYPGFYNMQYKTHYICGVAKLKLKHNFWCPRVLVWRFSQTQSIEAYVLDLTCFDLSLRDHFNNIVVKLKTNYMLIAMPRVGCIVLNIVTGHYKNAGWRTKIYRNAGWRTKNSYSTNFCEWDGLFHKDYCAVRTEVPVHVLNQ